jgi:hypothetical protein
MRLTKNRQHKLAGGLWVQWSPVNLSWLVGWHGAILRSISDREELLDYLRLDLGVTI